MSSRPDRRTSLAEFGRRVPAPIILIGALIFLQASGGLAKGMMSADNAVSLAFIRLGIGAAILGAIARPRWRGLTARQWVEVALLGVVFAAMNLGVYHAMLLMPLGLVATVGFLGPLALSLSGARRAVDFAWPALGFCGVLLLTPWHGAGAVSWAAIGAGLCYAVTWACFILASARVGRALPGLDGFVVAMAIATLLLAPWGAAGAGHFFSTPDLARRTLLMAVLASVPFGLEFLALKRLPTRVFGVLLSLEPGVASLTGMVLLHEHLTAIDALALVAVSAASMGVTLAREPVVEPAAH